MLVSQGQVNLNLSRKSWVISKTVEFRRFFLKKILEIRGLIWLSKPQKRGNLHRRHPHRNLCKLCLLIQRIFALG